MQTIIIEVRGGVVQEVYSNAADLQVVLVDWDNGESPGEKYDGGVVPKRSLDDLPNETRNAAMHVGGSL